MKIVVSANTSWYIYNFRKNLIRTILEAGHQVFVIAPPDDYVEKVIGLGVEYFPLSLAQLSRNPFREIVSCARFFYLLKKIQPDVVLTFTVKCNLYAGLINRFLNYKQIANISGLGEVFEKKGLTSYLVSKLYKLNLGRAKRVFFQNNEDMRTITEKGLLSSKICKRIPGSGVDLEAFYPTEFPKENKTRIFFMFGRLIPSKGYGQFLKTAEEIHLKKYNAEFWIMGIVDKTRSESKQLLDHILALQEKGVVRYLLPCDQVADIINKVDAVVLPSKYNEGVPRSLLEALACGKPIITTDWKGCRDTVDHGSNGYIINIDDYEALTKSIIELINAPDQELKKMGEASRKKAEIFFDEKQILYAYMDEICQCHSPCDKVSDFGAKVI